MNYDGILKNVEQKIKEASEVNDAEKLITWLKVLEKMKDCGLVQIHRSKTNILKQMDESLN